jgi:hypothetical protein
MVTRLWQDKTSFFIRDQVFAKKGWAKRRKQRADRGAVVLKQKYSFVWPNRILIKSSPKLLFI